MSFHFHGHHNHDWSNPSNWQGGSVPSGWNDTQVTYPDGAVSALSQNVDVNSLQFSGSGTLTIKGNGNEILNNGTTTIDSGVTVILDGTNIVGGNGGASAGPLEGDGTLIVKGGSNLNVGGMNTNLVFDNTSGYSTLTVNWTGNVGGTISNLTPGDTIDLHRGDSWVSSIAWEQNSDGSYRIVSPAVNQWSQPTTLIDHVTLAPGIVPSDFTWANGELVCYLRGTPILTDKGPVAVENLKVGDNVVVMCDNGNSRAPVKWVGWKKAVVDTTSKFMDFAGYPIRIEAGAVAAGVPYQDVLVTPEHCLFMNGHFVPARMLVNGKSIRYDTSITEYEYFHFETDSHHVVSAAGMLSESFLDTGNKMSFNSSSIGGTKSKTWAVAAFPLNTHSWFVEPLWKSIASRAGLSSYEIEKGSLNLHLISDDGSMIMPSRINGKKVIFQVPSDVEEVTIVSRAARPSDEIGPYVDDRRILGALIGGATLFGGRSSNELDYLTNSEGWYPAEGHQRWTNGSGKVTIGRDREQMPRILALHVDNI